MSVDGIYIYGFISANEPKNLGFAGIEQGNVYFLPYKDIAAVVSNMPLIKFDSLPREILLRNLAVYQSAIEKVMEYHHIVPVKYGTMTDSEDNLLRIMQKNYVQIKNVVDTVKDKIEIDVVALWGNIDLILKEIGEKEEIKRLKEEAVTKSPDQIFKSKINLGRMVKVLLDKKREECSSQLLDALKKEAESYRSHALMDDSMIMNTAFLIYKNKQETFESKVDQLDKQYNGSINFRIVGPIPPYSFTALEMKSMEFGEVNEARVMFALGEETTILEIKNVYRELSKKFHPDKYPGNKEAQKRFEKITMAYRILSDYCKEDQCSFKEADVRDWIDVREAVGSGSLVTGH